MHENALVKRRCQACEGGLSPLSLNAIASLQKQIAAAWQVSTDGKALSRQFLANNHYEIMAFINAIAFISHQEDHHPEVLFGYNTCQVRYTTHAIDGLSENDFICAAKVDVLGFVS